jgi:hypothetical protein
MNQYVITEEQLRQISYLINCVESPFCIYDKDEIINNIYSHPHQSEREMLEQKYSQLMAASINNEHPGWVQIADIGDILRPSDAVIPDIENLQEFPFRSYPKRKLRQKAGEQG